MTDDKQWRVRAITDFAVQDLIEIGAERKEALKLLAFQAVLRLCIDEEDEALLELRNSIDREVQDHINVKD